MADNRGVAYMEPGRVEVVDLNFPGLALPDGLGVNPANVGRQCPHGVILKVVSTNICKYHRQLMMAILHDRVRIAKAVNAVPIPLGQAPDGYRSFDAGAARKYVLDPHGLLGHSERTATVRGGAR